MIKIKSLSTGTASERAARDPRSSRMSLRRTTVAVAAVAVSTVGLTLTGAPAATAAGARPNFQVPFVCGQEWQGAMYSGHDPRMAIDFNHYAADGSRDDQGRRVVASAAGTVDTVEQWETSYGNHVIIRHGNGWTTLYAHLLDGSLTVAEGQPVSKGQVIGRVGASGLPNSDADHLHYEQRADRTAVLSYFYGDRPATDGATRAYRSPAC
jgi:murein DD-endopeptidase MepM/ murein hydrolase activator NlpD